MTVERSRALVSIWEVRGWNPARPEFFGHAISKKFAKWFMKITTLFRNRLDFEEQVGGAQLEKSVRKLEFLFRSLYSQKNRIARREEEPQEANLFNINCNPCNMMK